MTLKYKRDFQLDRNSPVTRTIYDLFQQIVLASNHEKLGIINKLLLQRFKGPT